MTDNSKTAPTVLEVAREVLRLADASPDFVYEQPEGYDFCASTFEGKGHCLIGQAMDNLGHLVSEDRTTESVSGLVEAGAITAVTASDFRLTGALRDAQINQDHGLTWGFAVDPIRMALEDLEDEVSA